jgi:acetyl esterase
LTLEGEVIPIRIYRPASETAILPVVVYLHGGGWVLGDLDTNDAVAWGLAEGTGAVVISVAYRLAPEQPYPAAFRDCFNAVKWVSQEAEGLEINRERLALCGDSAGGNLAAAVSLAARDQDGPPLAAQALIYPVLGRDMTLPSYRENGEGPGLTRTDMSYYLDAYLGSDWSRADAYALPMLATDLAGLPPTLVHTAELDPLRDEGRCFAQRLEQAGVKVSYRCAPRMVHGFVRARFEGPTIAAEFAVITDFLRRQLFG